MRRNDLTSEMLKALVEYDPLTGIFKWKVARSPVVKVGGVAGSISSLGYVVIGLYGLSYKGHLLAWLYMKGEWPKSKLDHENRIRSDNRFVNIREATYSENNQNKSKGKNNTSGHVGVSWCSAMKKYKAQIRVNGKLRHLGYFTDLDEAARVRLEATRVHHPFNNIK